MIRLIVALFGVVLAMVGHTASSPTVLVVGVAAVVPLAVRLLSLPARSRAAFFLSAVLAGLLLAGFNAAHNSTDTVHRPVSAACVVTR